MLKIAKSDFTNETWEEFANKHNLFWNKKIITDLAAGFWELFQWGEPEYDEFAEAYFEAIPKTYKKTLFPRKLIKEYVTLESYEDPEKDQLYKHLLTIIAGEIEAAVNRDKDAWNKTPTLPGLNPRGRKPGQKVEKRPTGSGLKALSSKTIEQYTEALAGASHKQIDSLLYKLFPVSEEESQRYFDGEELQDPAKEALIILSWLYQADIEVAAKEGSEGEVQDLLQQMNAKRKLSPKELLQIYENKMNPEGTPDPKPEDTKGFTPAKEYLEYLKSLPPLRENQ